MCLCRVLACPHVSARDSLLKCDHTPRVDGDPYHIREFSFHLRGNRNSLMAYTMMMVSRATALGRRIPGTATCLAAQRPTGATPERHSPEPSTSALGDISRTYKKLVAHKAGPCLRDVARIEQDLPVEHLLAGLGNDEVVIRVRYAGVNGGCETFRCRAEYAFSRNAHETGFALGAEGVGDVVASGDAGRHLVGSSVMFVGGAFSEFVRVKVSMCTPIESNKTDYVAIRISGNVAHAALKYVAEIRPGDVVLVTAAAGATGSFAVQYAKHVGCHVVATCRSDVKASILEGYGVDRVIQYTKEDVARVLHDEGYMGTIDVAYEGVGGELQSLAWDAIRPNTGRLLCVGYISEYPHTQKYASGRMTTIKKALPPSDELFWGGKTVCDPRGKVAYGNVWPSEASLRQESLVELCSLYQQGIIMPLIDPVEFIGVESIPDAMDYMLSGQALGKVVVRLYS